MPCQISDPDLCGGKNLAGVENVFGIERAFQRAHQRDLALVACPGKVVAFFETDPMLRRHRAAALSERTIDDFLDLVASLRSSVANAGNQVEISVAQMAEDHQGGFRPARKQAVAYLLNITLHC